MHYIDEKFKERRPEDTVALIQEILHSHGIEVTERWHDSGVDNCYSLSLVANGGIPISNGKGISKTLAQASAYGEFIERLQGGLFLSKFQSISRDPALNVYGYAPDAKYMSVQELVENGEWMDPIIQEYKNPRITRESIARFCKVFDVTSDDKVLTLPFYSLFEKKTVYIPIYFVDQIYGTNGCCAGNTRDEAWVHALSEIMERHASIRTLLDGKPVPKFSDEVISRFSTVHKIMTTVRETGRFEIDFLDYSDEYGYPVVAARIINKENHCYRVNVGADPVFEIALQRTLTEIFQGMNINNFTADHNGKILRKVSDDFRTVNIMNQLETSSGIFTADFFANELTCNRQPAEFVDNSNKSIKELLDYALGVFKKMGKPIYVRNFSYLGFPCYRFVVPGFSEALAVRLTEIFPEFSIAEAAAKVLKNPAKATDPELSMFLVYNKMVSGIFSRYYSFGKTSGLPILGSPNISLACITRAYAAYRLNQINDAIKFASPVCDLSDRSLAAYFSLVNAYLGMKRDGMDEPIIRSVLRKFHLSVHCDELFDALDQGKTPYDNYLMACDFQSCDTCRYREQCTYHANKAMYTRVGAFCKAFVDGQAESEFAI